MILKFHSFLNFVTLKSVLSYLHDSGLQLGFVHTASFCSCFTVLGSITAFFLG